MLRQQKLRVHKSGLSREAAIPYTYTNGGFVYLKHRTWFSFPLDTQRVHTGISAQ